MKINKNITCIYVCPNWWTSFNSKKNGRKRSFSYETKVSMSFIQIMRMHLWFPIMKKKEVLMCIHVSPIDKWTLILRKIVRRKAFLIKPKHHVIYPNEENVFIMPSHGKKKIVTWIHVCHNWQTNIDSKKSGGKKAFLWNQSINVIYSNKENVFMMPNHEKKLDYYVNPYLFQLKYEPQF